MSLSLRPLAALTVLCAAVALVAPSAASARGRCAYSDALPGKASRADFARATVCLLNFKRKSHGLRTLERDRRLTRAARVHNRDMVRQTYFAHVSRRGRDVGDRTRSTGYTRGARRWVVGENLAWGAGSRSTPRSIVRAWMGSAGHRRNILDRRFREIGIGVAFSAPVGEVDGPSATYTTTFGKRR